MSHFAGCCQFSGRWVTRDDFDYGQTFVENSCTHCDSVHRAILVLVPTILALGMSSKAHELLLSHDGALPQWCSLKLFCIANSQLLTKARTMSAHLLKSLLYFKVSHWCQLANQDVLYAPKSTSIPLLQRPKLFIIFKTLNLYNYQTVHFTCMQCTWYTVAIVTAITIALCTACVAIVTATTIALCTACVAIVTAPAMCTAHEFPL